jgi:DNA-binding transcriptional regulator GbsR (MarR family)
VYILKNQNVPHITDEQHRFVEDMGQHMMGWGVPRNTGRVYAYLLLQDGPASLDEIATDLGIAKSGASVATRQLVGFRLARAIGERGTRRLLYEALHSLEAIIAARNTQSIDLLERLREGAMAAPPGVGRRRLQEMAELMQELVDELPAIVRRIRDRRQT